MRSLLLLLLLVAPAAHAAVAQRPLITTTTGTTYYVSAAGNDANNGTSTATPWATFAKVSGGTVLYHPGDRILFRGGDNFTAATWTLQPTGGNTSDATNPIIISSYGGTGGPATLTFGDHWGLGVQDMSGVWVTNLNINGSGLATNLGSGFNIFNSLAGTTISNFVIDNVTFTGWGSSAADIGNGSGCGIWIGPSGTTSLLSNIRVTNNVMHDNAACGMMVTGWNSGTTNTRTNSNGYFAYNTAYNNKGVSGTTSANTTGSGLLISGFSGVTIEYNVAHDNGGVDNQTGGAAFGIWVSDTDNALIQFNEVYNQDTLGNFDGGGFDLDVATTNSTMQYNYSHNNAGPGFAQAEDTSTPTNNNNVIRYNISQNDVLKNGQGALHLANVGASASNVSNSYYYNNVVYLGAGTSSSAIGMKVEQNSVNTKIWNNIFITVGGRKLLYTNGTQTGIAVDGNDYFTSGGAFSTTYLGTTYTSFTSYKGTGVEAHGQNVDPLLTNAGGGGAQNAYGIMKNLTAYQLQPGSPMIDAGLALNTAFGVNPGPIDFFGNTLPQGTSYDIGANEYAGSAPSTGFTLIMPAGSTLVMPAGSTLTH